MSSWRSQGPHEGEHQCRALMLGDISAICPHEGEHQCRVLMNLRGTLVPCPHEGGHHDQCSALGAFDREGTALMCPSQGHGTIADVPFTGARH